MALGRGLSSLIPKKDNTIISSVNTTGQSLIKEAVFNIDIDKIFPNPFQPRKKFGEEGLNDLAQSIKEHGVLQPIIVAEINEGGEKKYQIIAGERRYRASKLAQLRYVPAILKNNKTDREHLELAILENVQREDLTPLEKAFSYKQLASEFNMTHAQIGERVGKGRVSVSNAIRLLELPSDAKEALEAGDISENHARAILSLSDGAMQARLLKEIKTQKLSARNTEVAARAMLKRPVKSMASQDQDVKDALAKLEGYLGTKVFVKPGKHVSDGGELVVKYFSNEDLKSIVSKIALDKFRDN
ncbi:MAG: ParB/RepB/Spo0J family partition protein [Patescibacteria group bacterium]